MSSANNQTGNSSVQLSPCAFTFQSLFDDEGGKYGLICHHTKWLSPSRSIFCPVCCFLYSFDSSRRRFKYTLSKEYLFNTLGLTIDKLAEKLEKHYASRGNGRLPAAGSLGVVHKCSRSNVSPPSTPYRGAFCDDAPDLLKCISVSSQTRGEYDAVHGESDQWYASCTGCSATCAGRSINADIYMILFFHFFKLRRWNNEFLLSFFICDGEEPVGERFAYWFNRVIRKSYSQRLDSPDTPAIPAKFEEVWKEMKNHAIQFQNRMVNSDIDIMEEIDCGQEHVHQFVLGNVTRNFTVKLTGAGSFFWLFMQKTMGYLIPEDNVSAYGLCNVGGMWGNLWRCNEDYYILHQHAYTGAHLGPPPADIITQYNQAGFEITQVRVNFHASEEDYRDPEIFNPEADRGRSCDRQRGIHRTKSVDSIFSRVKNLVGSVGACIDGLHKVVDWPIDSAVGKILQVTGYFKDVKAEHGENAVDADIVMLGDFMQDLAEKVDENMNLVRKKMAESNALTINALERLEKKIDSINFVDMEDDILRLQQAVGDINNHLDKEKNGSPRGKKVTTGVSRPTVNKKPWATRALDPEDIDVQAMGDFIPSGVRKACKKLNKQVFGEVRNVLGWRKGKIQHPVFFEYQEVDEEKTKELPAVFHKQCTNDEWDMVQNRETDFETAFSVQNINRLKALAIKAHGTIFEDERCILGFGWRHYKSQDSEQELSIDSPECFSKEMMQEDKEVGQSQTSVKHEGTEELIAETIEQRVVEDSAPSDAYNDALKMEYHLGTFKWEVSKGRMTTLESFRLPDKLWEKSYRLEMLASCFQYYHVPQLRIRVATTAAAVQGGTLALCWDPLSARSAMGFKSVEQMLGGQCVFLDAGKSATATLIVDNPCVQNRVCLMGSEKSNPNFGTLNICCINTLNVPSDTNQYVNVNVWVSFVNPKMEIFTIPHTVQKQMAGIAKVEEKETTHIERYGMGNMMGLIHQGSWSTTSSSHVVSLLVHPCAVKVEEQVVFQTPLSLLSSCYSRWKGSLKYSIIFGASQFTKGKIVIGAIPVLNRNSNPSMESLVSMPHVVFDLTAESNEVCVEVPFYSIAEDLPTQEKYLYDILVNGAPIVTRLHFMVLDELVLNANASNEIDFCVFVGPGKDFQLRYVTGLDVGPVPRTLKHADEINLGVSSGSDHGAFFRFLLERESLLCICDLGQDGDTTNHFRLAVAPAMRSRLPHATIQNWLAQAFTTWSGDLIYSVKMINHDLTKQKMLRVWYEPNGQIPGGEFEFRNDCDPPAGINVHWHDVNRYGKFDVLVPFQSRFRKLVLPKPCASDESLANWPQYNGVLCFDLEGDSSLSVEITLRGASNLMFYDQGSILKCGKVNAEKYTKLHYAELLSSVSDPPNKNGDRIIDLEDMQVQGVIHNYKGDKILTVDKDKVKEEKEKKKKPKSPEKKDKAASTSKDPESVSKQGMQSCLPFLMGVTPECVKGVQEEALRMMENKVPEQFELNMQKLAELDTDKLGLIADDLAPIIALLKERLPGMLESTESLIQRGHTKLDDIVGIMSTVKNLILKKNLPAVVFEKFKNGDFIFGALLSVLGTIILCWIFRTKSIKKISHKVMMLMMLAWSPILGSKAIQFYSWMTTHLHDLFAPLLEKMRKNSPEKFNKEASQANLSVGWSEKLFEWIRYIKEFVLSKWQDLLTPVCSVIGVITGLCVWGSIPDGKKITSLGEKFKMIGQKGIAFDQVRKGWDAISLMATSMAKAISGWVLDLYGDKALKCDKALGLDVEFDIANWAKELSTMALEENKWVDFSAPARLQKVRHMFDRSLELQQAMLKAKSVPPAVVRILTEAKKTATNLLNDSYNFKGMDTTRVDPYFLCLAGDPGVGKSAIVKKIIGDLLDDFGYPRTDRVYTRCCADAYWSSYHSQPAVYFDDLGSVDRQGGNSDYGEIMGCKTNDPFAVPMAAVEEKGRFFSSDFIFACTNKYYLDNNAGVAVPRAYYRRRNSMVVVERIGPMQAHDPTLGLVFHVRDTYRVENPKTEWEHFYPKEDIPVSNLSYEAFLGFLKSHVKYYMANQKKLLASTGSRRNREIDMSVYELTEEEKQLIPGPLVGFGGDPGVYDVESCKALSEILVRETERDARETKSDVGFWEDRDEDGSSSESPGTSIPNWDSVSKQMCRGPKKTRVEFKDLVEMFNVKCGPRVIEFTDYLGVKAEWPTKWKRMKVLNFEVLLRDLCGCRDNNIDGCTYHLYLNHLRTCCCDFHITLPYGMMRAVKANFNWMYSTYELSVPIEDIFKLNPLGVFLYLIEQFGFDKRIIGGQCVNRYNLSLLSQPGGDGNDPKDWFDVSENGEQEAGRVLIHWEDVDRFFPEVFKLYQCVVVPSAKGWIIFHNAASLPADLDCEVVFSVMRNMRHNAWSDPKDFLSELQKMEVDSLCTEIIDLALGMPLNEITATTLELFLDNCSSLGMYATCLLNEMRRQSLDRLTTEAKIAAIESRLQVATRKYEVEKVKWAEEASPWMKTLLMVGAGLVAIGGAVALGYGTYKGIKALMRVVSGEQKSKKVYRNRGIPVVPANPENKRAQRELSFKAHSILNTHLAKPEAISQSAEHHTGKKSKKNQANKKTVGGGRVLKTWAVYKEAMQSILQDEPRQLLSKEHFQDVKKWNETLKKAGIKKPLYDEKRSEMDNIIYTAGMVFFKNALEEGPGDIVLTIKDEAPEVDREAITNLYRGWAKDVFTKGLHVQEVTKQEMNYYGPRDTGVTEFLDNVALRASAVIYNEDNNSANHVIRVVGSWVICPIHYFEHWDEESKLHFICMDKATPIVLDRRNIIQVADMQDLALWNLGPQVPPARDIRKHMMNKQDWNNWDACDGILTYTNFKPDCAVQHVHYMNHMEAVTINAEAPTALYSLFDGKQVCVSGLRYSINSADGFCGGLVINKKGNRKLAGIHIAGNNNYAAGYGEMLCKETIDTALAQFALRDSLIDGEGLEQPDAEIVRKECSKGWMKESGTISLRGIIEKPKLIPQSVEFSEIIPSPIFGLFFEHQSEPAILSRRDKRLGSLRGQFDPKASAIVKYGVKTKPFAESEILPVEIYLSDVFSNYHNSLQRRQILSEDEVVNGIPGSSFWLQISMHTSPGYPYVLRRPVGCGGKRWMFEELEPYENSQPRYKLQDSQCLKKMAEREQAAKENKMSPGLMVECTKDERRALKKIYENPATRTFTILPLEQNLLIRKYFLDFAVMIMENRWQSFTQVGLNVFSMEWSDLMLRLREKGEFGFAGDYAKFDGIGPAEIYRSITNVVNSWYNDGDENAQIRHVLIKEIVHRHALVNDEVVQYSQGLPSGFSMTVIFNSLVNYYFLAMAWAKCVGDSKMGLYSDIQNFDHFCKVLVYGDDNVVAVHDSVKDIYNLQTVAGFLKEHGVTYTDDKKNPIEESEPYNYLETFTFLKREWKRLDVGGMFWKAPLAIKSIQDQCNWIRKCDDPWGALEQNISNALYEASLHGKGYFDTVQNKLRECYTRCCRPYKTRSYRQQIYTFWSYLSAGCVSPYDLWGLVHASDSMMIEPKKIYLNKHSKQYQELTELLKTAQSIPTLELAV